MRRKRFRIVCSSDGDSYYYDTRIKTWFGWISFTVLYNTFILHVLSDPVGQKARAYERIYQYCESEGYRKDRILITEVCEGEGNKMVHGTERNYMSELLSCHYAHDW